MATEATTSMAIHTERQQPGHLRPLPEPQGHVDHVAVRRPGRDPGDHGRSGVASKASPVHAPTSLAAFVDGRRGSLAVSADLSEQPVHAGSALVLIGTDLTDQSRPHPMELAHELIDEVDRLVAVCDVVPPSAVCRAYQPLRASSAVAR
jgi:hypothetical protein